jgi:cytochrome o ubiquinol oxidase operon protein cyoD
MTTLNYIVGYVLSALLTLAAAGLLWVIPAYPLISVAFVVLALCQLIVQLVFFLHLGQGKSPSSNLTLFAFALIVVGIVVGGTLWIMNNLQSQHAMPQEFLNDVPAPQNQLE